MKPLIIIAIAVGCSVVAMIGVLAIFQQVENSEIQKENDARQEYLRDLDLAEMYRIQYLDISYNSCLTKPPPSSVVDAAGGLAEVERILAYVEKMQSTVEDLEQKMELLQEKYRNDDFFVLEKANCPYEKEWAEAYSLLQQYEREQNP